MSTFNPDVRNPTGMAMLTSSYVAHRKALDRIAGRSTRPSTSSGRSSSNPKGKRRPKTAKRLKEKATDTTHDVEDATMREHHVTMRKMQDRIKTTKSYIDTDAPARSGARKIKVRRADEDVDHQFNVAVLKHRISHTRPTKLPRTKSAGSTRPLPIFDMSTTLKKRPATPGTKTAKRRRRKPRSGVDSSCMTDAATPIDPGRGHDLQEPDDAEQASLGAVDSPLPAPDTIPPHHSPEPEPVAAVIGHLEATEIGPDMIGVTRQELRQMVIDEQVARRIFKTEDLLSFFDEMRKKYRTPDIEAVISGLSADLVVPIGDELPPPQPSVERMVLSGGHVALEDLYPSLTREVIEEHTRTALGAVAVDDEDDDDYGDDFDSD